MKLFIEQNDLYTETEIHIKCGIIDTELQRIIDEIQTLTCSFPVSKDGAVCKLSLENIFYFESVDEKTFVYTQEDVYECGYKLYEIEEKFGRHSFARISKSVIVNIRKIQQIKPQLNGRFEALLDNGEHVIINRHYVGSLKEKFVGG
ncbi:MAG: LytTR family transcriptional regulator DNA-binding domain-containing protein [Lachnospiraceae bacterium]|nr:LytTR family transcriptional regulator DNA-binding domain-containing protein [Lachnospiraceae bacterium]